MQRHVMLREISLPEVVCLWQAHSKDGSRRQVLEIAIPHRKVSLMLSLTRQIAHVCIHVYYTLRFGGVILEFWDITETEKEMVD